jgi:antitoxin component of MazEF toxin-antitoxin module
VIKTITKVGNSQGLILDAAVLDLARLKAGDQVNLTVHEGGTITLTPLRPRPSPAEVTKVIQTTMRDYSRTFRRLA